MLSDNTSHLIASVAVLAACVVIIIFAPHTISPDYVFGTSFTIVGTLLGYKIGSNSNPVPQQAATPIEQAESPAVSVSMTGLPAPVPVDQWTTNQVPAAPAAQPQA